MLVSMTQIQDISLILRGFLSVFLIHLGKKILLIVLAVLLFYFKQADLRKGLKCHKLQLNNLG